MDKVFAPEHLRTEEGWILFPRDAKDRKELFFPEEVMAHPAKMNFHLQQSIIEYVAEPGQILLDPFGGTGTLMIAALQGMYVVLLEIEEGYHNLQVKVLESLRQVDQTAANRVTLLHGDNRFLLPIPCHHIITSPPYAAAMSIKRVREVKEGSDGFFAEQDRQMMEYTKSQRNIGRLNTFYYNQAMEKVYSLCYQSLIPGGTLTTVVKDRINNGQRTYLSKWITKVCTQVGFKEYGWFKWKSPGNWATNIRRSRDEVVVEDEDIIIYRK